jgi:hypothetical protein
MMVVMVIMMVIMVFVPVGQSFLSGMAAFEFMRLTIVIDSRFLKDF